MKHVLRRIGALNAMPDMPVGLRLIRGFLSTNFTLAAEGNNIFVNRLDVDRGVVLIPLSK